MRTAVLSSARWGEYRGSMHYLAMALAELGHDTLYVDPPVSPFSLVRHPDRASDLVASTDEQLGDRLRLWRPRVLPGQNSGLGQRVNRVLLRRGIRRRLDEPTLSICFTLEPRSVMTKLPGARVYSCIDSLRDLPGVDTARVARWERELVDVVDVVVACSEPQRRQLQTIAGDVAFIPHGCHPSFLFDHRERPIPPELVGRRRPYVGYVGSMNFRLDAQLLDAARRGADGGTLVLVGGSFSSAGPRPDHATRSLIQRPDVVTTGHRGHDELAPYVWALDVGVVPYASTPFNRKSYPIKIPQYLAAGCPVVSTRTGATDHLHEWVAVAETPREFEAAVHAAVERDGPGERLARRAVAAARPWTLVAEELLTTCRAQTQLL